MGARLRLLTHTMTVLRKSRELKPHTTSKLLRRDPHSILKGLWLVTTLSLALDPWIAAHGAPAATSGTFGYGALVMALATLPFLDRRRMASMISRVRRINKRESERTSLVISFILGGSVVLTLLFKVLLLPRIDNILALIFVGCLIVGALKHIQHTVAGRSKERDALKTSPTRYIQNWESQLVTLSAMPIVMARSISALATVASTSSDDHFFRIVALFTSFTFLLILKPARDVFAGFCVKCRHPTPIVYVEYGSCPECNDTLKNERH